MSRQHAAALAGAPRIASRRAVLGVSALAFTATSVTAQTSASFQPTRCVRDTTTALTAVADIATADSVSGGIRYRCLYLPRGPWALHIVSIDLANRRYAVEGTRAFDAMLGRERVSAMAQRLIARGDTPVVAINADFFGLRTGEVENNTVIRGAWVKGIVIPDSGPEIDNARSQFAVDQHGRPLIGRFELHADVRFGGITQRLLGINAKSRARGLVLYTPWFGTRTPADSTTQQVEELVLQDGRSSGADIRFRVRRASPVTGGGGAVIPRDGAVLSATGPAVAILRRIGRGGGTVLISAKLGDHASPRTAVGGWGRLIKDSVSVAAFADSLEGTRPTFSSARHPRSAIAISRDSSTLMLVVVDGRRPWSVGMSLAELADQLLALGAYQAMNLDGGGSSTLWVRGTIVNYPSDAAGERAVGNALVVVKRPRP